MMLKKITGVMAMLWLGAMLYVNDAHTEHCTGGGVRYVKPEHNADRRCNNEVGCIWMKDGGVNWCVKKNCREIKTRDICKINKYCRYNDSANRCESAVECDGNGGGIEYADTVGDACNNKAGCMWMAGDEGGVCVRKNCSDITLPRICAKHQFCKLENTQCVPKANCDGPGGKTSYDDELKSACNFNPGCQWEDGWVKGGYCVKKQNSQANTTGTW